MLRRLPARGAVLCTLAMLGGWSQAQAQAENTGFGFVFEGDLEYGGDEIATLEFVDGSSQDVKTGQGITLALGGHYRADGSPFSVRGTVGYKYVTTKASNADISIGRTVVEVVGNYLFANNWWVAAGLTHHTGIKFDGDDFAPDIDFKDATGPTVEVGWRWIALSYTKLEYKGKYGGEADASSFGLTLISKF
ncbi:hypothetical protein [Steroidobacter cummioxidans]|uniref:hypothetical protein n=1 Tax=Steroidobacter cummioxidans TaxID=1803913 RepID=UPI0012907AE5|nr:hypothetical protein [Steroidobacter cummioxidans]